MISKVGKKTTPAKTPTNNDNIKKKSVSTPKATPKMAKQTPHVDSGKKVQTPMKKQEKTPKSSKDKSLLALSGKKSAKTGDELKATPKAVTPKQGKGKGKARQDKECALSLQHSSDQLPSKDQLTKFVKALYKVHKGEVGTQSAKEKKKLFDEDGLKIHVQVNGIKLPKESRKQILKVFLPNSVIPDPVDVCLLVKDLKKGRKEDPEDSVNHFKDLLESKGVKNINEVMSLRQLKVEHKPYEAKLALCKRYDVFLADDRIVRFIPKFLGKPFYSRKKFPIPVNLMSKDLKVLVNRAINTVTLPLTHQGTTSLVHVGNTTMDERKVVDNLCQVMKVLADKYPGGVNNIRVIHLKTEKSMAIPIHVNTDSGNDIGFVDTKAPPKITKQSVTGELSTRPGMEVTVTPFGTIKVTKKGDPGWDDEKDEPFISGSEVEDEPEEENDQHVRPKKRKVEEKKKKKAKKAKRDEDSDQEDEGIQQTETAYMKRNILKQDESEDDDEKEEEDSDQEEDDGEAEEDSDQEDGEEEEEDSEDQVSELEFTDGSDSQDSDSDDEEEFDDEQELDAQDVIVDSDEDEDEESEEDDDKIMLPKNVVQQEASSDEEEKEVKPKVKKLSKNERRKQRNQSDKKAKTTSVAPVVSKKKGKGRK